LEIAEGREGLIIFKIGYMERKHVAYQLVGLLLTSMNRQAVIEEYLYPYRNRTISIEEHCPELEDLDGSSE